MTAQQDRRDLIEFAATLARKSEASLWGEGQGVIPIAVELCRLARRLHTRYERMCNEDVPEGFADRLEGQISTLANALGAEVVFQRDPRGAPVRLFFLGDLEPGEDKRSSHRGVYVPY